jgi:hypothetical protein
MVGQLVGHRAPEGDLTERKKIYLLKTWKQKSFNLKQTNCKCPRTAFWDFQIILKKC